MHTFLRSPAIRQLTGAVVGAMVALAVYTAGNWAVGHMHAMLMDTAAAKEQITEETRAAKMDRIAAAAKEKAAEYVELEK
jgi:hypothetical protein